MPPAGESAIPIFCYVTDRTALDAGDSSERLIATIRAAIGAGVDWVQIREKDLSARDLLALTAAAVSAARNSGQERAAPARVIVNDRLDVALAASAAGVHLGRNSAPAAEVVRWRRSGNAPAEFLIGVSCHSLGEALRAEAQGASYVFFGPIFETPSKRPFGPPQGIVRLGEICKAVRIPVIAIGGLDAANAPECLRAGAAGMAAIRFFQEENGRALAEKIAKLRG